MHPIICQLGPVTIYSYGLMLVAAFFAASALVLSQAGKEGLDREILFNLLFTVFIAGIIGARIFYVIENAGYYLRQPLEAIKLQHGGLSWFGGLILGLAAGFFYLRRKNMPVYKTLDLIAPFIALGQAIGRIGCLLNGCCFGRPSEYGIYFPVHHAVLIPTQAYSSLALVVIFIILKALQARPHRRGEIFFSYLMLYSAKRFIIEFWRADNALFLWGLTVFQVFSIALFCLSALKLFWLMKPRH